MIPIIRPIATDNVHVNKFSICHYGMNAKEFKHGRTNRQLPQKEFSGGGLIEKIMD